MKVKCKICGTKGYYEYRDKISEFHSSEFLWIHYIFNSKTDFYICRKCICNILDSLRREQKSIENLYKPEINSKENSAKSGKYNER